MFIVFAVATLHGVVIFVFYFHYTCSQKAPHRLPEPTWRSRLRLLPFLPQDIPKLLGSPQVLPSHGGAGHIRNQGCQGISWLQCRSQWPRSPSTVPTQTISPGSW